jgi:hypothetical protein
MLPSHRSRLQAAQQSRMQAGQPLRVVSLCVTTAATTRLFMREQQSEEMAVTRVLPSQSVCAKQL